MPGRYVTQATFSFPGASHEPFFQPIVLFASAVSFRLCGVCRLCCGRRACRAVCGVGCAAAQAKPKIRAVFCETPNSQPIWPNIGYDFDARRKQLLEVLAQGCPDVQLLPMQVMDDPKHADDVLQGDSEVDGYLVFVQGLGWKNDIFKLCTTAKPTLLVDNLFGGSGHFLAQLPRIINSGKPVDWVSSSNDQDIVASARNFALLAQGKTAAEVAGAFRAARRKNTPTAADLTCQPDPVPVPNFDEALRKLRETKILVVGGGWGGDVVRKASEEVLGVKLIPIAFAEMAAAYAAADPEAAKVFADRWIAEAQQVVEPAREQDRESGHDVRRHEATPREARRQRHQHQLPGRLLWRTPPGLPVPRASAS